MPQLVMIHCLASLVFDSGCGVGTIILAVDDMDSTKADVLVMDSQPLGFDQLIGMDVIKMLGGISINKSGETIFSRMNSYICAAIKMEELDFSAEFDDRTRVWTDSWKWSGDQPPNNLINRVPE